MSTLFRRIIYEDDWYQLSIGIFGGLLLHHKRRGLFQRVPKPNALFFHSIVSRYQALGGRVEPNDEGMMHLAAQLIMAISPGNDWLARIYYSKTPDDHAREALAIAEIV